MDGYNPKLHALTGEAHGMAAALNVPRVSCCASVFGWLATRYCPPNQQLYINGVKMRTLSMVENKGVSLFFYFTPKEISGVMSPHL